MAVLVQAPARRPRQGGIKSIIDFTPEGRIIVSQGGLVWEDSGCGLPKNTQAGCYDDVVEPADKTFDGVVQYGTIGDPFVRYAGVQCYLGGDSVGQRYADQARTLLDQGEDRAVEAVLWDWAAAAPTPGSAASIAAAIGVAEEYADANYVGAPIIVLSRLAADLAFDSGVLVRENGRLVTPHGNYVLATGSVPDAEDDNTVVAIGGLAVYASEMLVRGAINRANNIEMALAERAYVIGVDCDFRYAVAVDVP